MEQSVFHNVLRAVASAMEVPVVIILILFIAFSVFCIGWVITEMIVERSHLKYSLPKLLDELKSGDKSVVDCIDQSGLLQRQKAALLELTKHPDFDRQTIEDLSQNLLQKEYSHYDSILKITGLIAKLAPMAGLLGTLIPLGPGIIALGQGDTYTLSTSLLTAFDTTIAGLVAAGICLVIHTLRSKWYSAYMSDLETLADCVSGLVIANE